MKLFLVTNINGDSIGIGTTYENAVDILCDRYPDYAEDIAFHERHIEEFTANELKYN